MSDDQPLKSPNVVDSVYDKLELPELEGAQIANAWLLREVVIKLNQLGTITDGNLEEMISQIEDRVSEMEQAAHSRITAELSEDGKRFAVSIIDRRTKSANNVTQKLRDHLAEKGIKK
jgi:hypothetical protein